MLPNHVATLTQKSATLCPVSFFTPDGRIVSRWPAEGVLNLVTTAKYRENGPLTRRSALPLLYAQGQVLYQKGRGLEEKE